MGVAVDEGQLAENLAGPEHVQNGLLAVRSQDADGDPSGGEQVQRVSGVPVVEDHLTFGEPPPPAGAQQLVPLTLLQAGETGHMVT